MIDSDPESAVLRFLDRGAVQFDSAADEEKLLRIAVRAVREFFRADCACIALLPAGCELADVAFELPRERDWDRELLTAYLRKEEPDVPANVILAPIRRRERTWAALALRLSSGTFRKGDGRLLLKITRRLSERLQQMDLERVLEIRSRIDRKIMEQIRPRDLFYQLLHGLRAVLRYDHSSALLMAAADGRALELEAEQLAYVKGKSRRIGRRYPLDEPLRALLSRGGIHGFDRPAAQWEPWSDPETIAIARLLDTSDDSIPAPAEGCLICAPIATKDGVIGVLKVAGLHAGTFKPYDAKLLEHFTAPASVAIQYLQRTESLEDKMLAAEKKHAVANIARGVSHDINNALGAVLPLVQQLREEAGDGRLDPETLAADLVQIEESLQVSRRIFGGMLSLARGSARSLGEGNVRRAIDGTLAILGDGMTRRGIEVRVEMDGDLPAVRAGQGDLTQLLLNLISNARDAMPHGGELTVEAQHTDDGVRIDVRDTGQGIPRSDLHRIEEPFFSTKQDGNGLGLSICRSIVWDTRGDMRFESEPGAGTVVTLVLPASTSLEPAGAT